MAATPQMKLAMAIQAVDEASKPLQRIARNTLKLVRPADKASKAVSKVGKRRNFRPLLRSLQKLGKSLNRVAAKVRALAKRSALWVGGAMVAAGALVYKVAAAGDKIAKTADKLGLGIGPLQEFRYAAERSGLSVEMFDKSMEYLLRTAGETAAGVGAAKDVYKALGISVKDSNGDLKGGEALLTEVADALAKVENPTARATLAYKLFGRSGMNMVNMLKGGSKGLAEMRREARETGSVMSDKTARASETFQDRLLDLKRIFIGLAQNIVGRFLPAINKLMTSFRDWYKVNRELISSKLSEWISKAAAVAKGFFSTMGDIAKAVWGVWEAIKELIPGLGDATGNLDTWKTAGKVLAGILSGALLAALVAATSAAWGFTIALLANPITWIILGIMALIAAGYLLWKNWDKVSAFFLKIWDGVKENWGRFFNDIVALLEKPLAQIQAGWESLMSFLGGIWSQLTDWISGFAGLSLAEAGQRLLQGYLDGLVWVWNALLSWWGGIFQTINGWIADLTGFDLLAAGTNLLGGFWEGIKGAWTSINTWLDESLASINTWISDLLGFDLAEAGRGLIGGFWDGLKSMWESVTAWLSGAIEDLTAWLPDWVKDKLGLSGKVEKSETVTNVNKPAGPIPQTTASGQAQQFNGRMVVEIQGATEKAQIKSMKVDGNTGIDMEALGQMYPGLFR